MNNNHETKKTKKAWPTKDAMEQVYQMKLWGSGASDFYSGDGSHHSEIVDPYKEALILFLTSFKKSLKVCDLGCGDFNVGKEFVKYTSKYIAVDIVENLIEYNKQKFQEDNLEFRCLDIAVDNLPIADCAIVRQVLQHLSNTEVQSVVEKLAKYKYVILTEHLPKGDFVPNKELISGQGIRIKKKSGVSLLSPPFNFRTQEEKQLLSIDLGNNKGVIVTTLYTVF